MDITEILPLVIFGLIYLFGSAAKKKAEQAKKAPTQNQPTTSPKKSGGLQARLEEALREMQGRVEPKDQMGARTGQSLESHIEPQIEQMTASTLYDRDLFTTELKQTEPKPQPKKRSSYDFRSQMEEVPNETYHGHGFTGFNESHGLHAIGETTTSYDDSIGTLSTFHEARGMHSTETLFPDKRRGKTLNDGGEKEPLQRAIFQNAGEVRQAIVVAEILGKPKALR